MTLERATIEGNSPVFENHFALLVILLEYHEAWKPCGKQAELSAKAKYVRHTDSEPVPWGKGEKQGGNPGEIEPETILPTKSRSPAVVLLYNSN